ncbi:glycosyltransferase [Gynuella sp.]|uniref:glycosyltransferase n=1 Tax=Gynuella sp. TaxID=2969146 RepID=UPI003D0EBA70
MRITLFSIGTQGDVRPLVALGTGLRRAGHEVRLACNHSFRELVQSAGLEFAPINADFLELMATEPEAVKKGKNIFKFLSAGRKGLLNMASQWAEQGKAAAKDADLLLGNGMTVPLVASLAEVFKKPFVQTHLQPVTPTRAIPPMGLPLPQKNRPGLVNLASYHILRFFVWQALRPAINGVLRKQLGLVSYPWYGPYYKTEVKNQPLIYGYSQHLIPKPKDWTTRIEISGFWFYDQAESWEPPPHLQAFLEEGPKPIYVGFGSMLTGRDSEELTIKVIKAIRLSGYRAILATGWGGMSAELADGMEKHICVIKHAPHDWLFPRVELAVHHGGAGTTAATVRAGIPSVVLPFLGDQPFWAWNLKRLNVSPGALNLESLTAEQLAHNIQLAGSELTKENAASLGHKIRSEDGVENAVIAMRRLGYIE